MTDIKVGFIGLGIMGSRMAGHLLDTGYELTIYNRSPEKASALVEKGATLAENPRDVGENADIVITMLAHLQAVEAVALGEDGLLNGLSDGDLWVDCTTTNPSFARQMAHTANEQGIRFLEAPVGGSKNQVTEQQLIIIAGGSANDLETARPLLDTFSQRIVHAGDSGMGISLKIVINHMLGTTMAAFAEALSLGQALGIEQATLLNVLVGGPVAPPYLAGKRGKIETDDYDVEFPLRWMQKDLHMVAEAAYETNTAMPISNATKELFQMGIRQGFGDEDFSAVVKVLQND